MKAIPLLLIGAAGHCHSLLSVVHRQAVYKPVGLIDSVQPIGKLVHGLEVLGCEFDILTICKNLEIQHLFVALGDNTQRQRLTTVLRQSLPSCTFATLIDPSAVIAADASLGPGVAVMAQAHVGSGTRVGEGSLINTAASIDHDSELASFASLAPGAVSGGNVIIGKRTAIGLGARIIHRISIGADSVIGAGSLILNDLPDGIVAYGSPAVIIRKRGMGEPYL